LVSDTTVTRFFRRIGAKWTSQMFSVLVAWQLYQMTRQQPIPSEGYTLDFDSSVVERYGHQEGARRGYNPRKPGRPSHHPLLAVLAPTQTIAHSWLRPGDVPSASGGEAFFDETMAILKENRIPVGRIRGDSAFGNESFLKTVESTYRDYAIAARFTGGLQGKISLIQSWRRLDVGLEIAETTFQAQGWSRERRIIVVRQHKPEREQARGRQLRLLADPEYVYQAVITNMAGLPEAIWRFYRGRSDMENRFKELKWDYGADGFCMQKFYATEAAFRLICFLFNMVTLWQRALGYPSRHTLGTLRTQVLACGAILGRSGKALVLRLGIKDRWQQRFLNQLKGVRSTELRYYGAVGTG
jgi:Transposase DDE domain group 1